MLKLEEIINLLENDGDIKENVSLKTLTTLKVGGISKYVFYPKDVTSLKKALTLFKENNINYKIFGNGSNIIPSDKIYDGVIIKLSSLNNLKINDEVIEVEAGYSLMKLAKEVIKLGLSGLEWANGIPGTIGGAVYMNAGAYKQDMSFVLEKITALDENMNIVTLNKDELDFSYRHSRLMEENLICLSATLKLEKKDISLIEEVVNKRKEKRMETQPLEYPSAGSVFRNPFNDFAGRLVEECNLKGKQIGGAMISLKHANFIINKDNATGKDVLDLINLAKKEVKEKFNIELKQEQELFNFD
ncbi:MAG TPA: UDP-N-acetylmuramate dehydrogenase [Bacilli bacterium]|nr:uDP-N-acetylenolpyruvoylglucosamine reductase [Mycoplasma sp. CAG:611]HJJ07782.1 UDP-N-acetylmuramate dehydrogenase [Bacilli bacterium]